MRLDDYHPPAHPVTRLQGFTRLKWQAFRLLERIGDMHGGVMVGGLELQVPATPMPALWVFASTIGELNAISPFLRRLADALAHLKLVLVTDRSHYNEAYVAQYPRAVVCSTRGHGDHARTLAKHYPPRMLVVCEIPCQLSDAPCRLPFAILHEAKRHGASAIVVNGWLYGERPSNRLDRIERLLFARDYVRAFDVLCMQTDEGGRQMIDAGATAARVKVVGNIKFDAAVPGHWSAAAARSPKLLGSLIATSRPVIVAGCVTNLDEQVMVLDAFLRFRAHSASGMLVLAPRHPEVKTRMAALRAMLLERGLVSRFRSELADLPMEPAVDCLILDTMGELKDFYAVATIAHVGINHNVLEPLAYRRPVTVSPGWQASYPSYPVYRMLKDAGVLTEATNSETLGDAWIQGTQWRDSTSAASAPAVDVLERLRGSVDRHFNAIGPLLDVALWE